MDFALIKKQGGWKSDAIVWDYIDEGRQFADNAAHALIEKMGQLMSEKYLVDIKNGLNFTYMHILALRGAGFCPWLKFHGKWSISDI